MKKKRSPTVCKELHRQKFITDEELRRDLEFADKKISKGFLRFYRRIIWPVIALMERSKLFSKLVFFIAWNVWLRKSTK